MTAQTPVDVPPRPVHPWVTEGGERVRIGVSTGVDPDHGAMRAKVAHLAELGVDGLFIPDHPMLMGDPWMALAGVADICGGMRLGTLVSCAAYRHPAMLARAVADLDRISGGRAVLGLGSGDMPHEFGMLGMDYGTGAARRALLEQNLDVVPRLVRGERVTYEGTGFALRDAVLPMPAIQEEGVPVLVAGGSRTVLRLVAQHGDAANLGAAAWAGGAYGADDVAAKCALIRELCLAQGRPPNAVLPTALVGVSLGDTRAEAEAALDSIPPPMRGFFGQMFVPGTPDGVGEHLEVLVGAGIRYVVVIPVDAFMGSRRMTDRLMSDVVPRLRSAGIPTP